MRVVQHALHGTENRAPGVDLADALIAFRERERLPLGSHRCALGPVWIDAGDQVVMRIATSYFVTEERCPGVSPAGIALRISSPRL